MAPTPMIILMVSNLDKEWLFAIGLGFSLGLSTASVLYTLFGRDKPKG